MYLCFLDSVLCLLMMQLPVPIFLQKNANNVGIHEDSNNFNRSMHEMRRMNEEYWYTGQRACISSSSCADENTVYSCLNSSPDCGNASYFYQRYRG